MLELFIYFVIVLVVNDKAQKVKALLKKINIAETLYMQNYFGNCSKRHLELIKVQ